VDLLKAEKTFEAWLRLEISMTRLEFEA